MNDQLNRKTNGRFTGFRSKTKAKNKNRIFLDVPISKSVNLPPIQRLHGMTSPYDNRPSSYQRALPDRYVKDPSGTRRILYEKVFHPKNKQRTPRKGMIIGERPSLLNINAHRRPQLPGSFFVGNLQNKQVNWRQYDTVTWNEILDSYKHDVYMHRPREFAQTLSQKDAWLASIDTRDKYSKMNHQKEFPSISTRLFNCKVAPAKPPNQTRYMSKDKMGNLYYLVGPSDVTKMEYRNYVFPERVSRVQTPPKLNF